MTTRNVTNSAFTSYPVTTSTLADGRQLTHVYDLLYRRSQVQETSGATNIAAWQFFGPSRVAEVSLGNGLICTWMNNTRTHGAVQPSVANPAWGNQSSDRLGYDGAARPITKRFLADGINGSSPYNYNDPSAIVGFTTEYDRSSNKLYERHLHAESRSHLYEPFSNGSSTGGYDSLDRLRQYQRGVLSSTGGFANNGGGSVATAISLPGTDRSRTYDLDGLGNWRRTVFTPEGGAPQTEIRQHNGLNEITRIQNGATQTNLTYDGTTGHSNGNLKNDGTRSYAWDALNRLMQVKRTSDNAIIGQYVYDALNRRIRKVIPDLGGGLGGLTGDIPAGTTDCIYSGWRCVEERDGSNNPTIQYVWGIYLDELLQQKTYVNTGSQPLSAGAYYPLQDLLYRTTALTDSSGAIVEAYDTDAYGNTLIFKAAGSGGNWWADDAAQTNYPACTFIFTGQRFDAETRLYYYKMRFYSSTLGRFVSKDPASNLVINPARQASSVQDVLVLLAAILSNAVSARVLRSPVERRRLFGLLFRLQRNNDRRYEPSVQRWMSQDPLGLGPDSNPYQYVGNGPTNVVDPSGLQSDSNASPSPQLSGAIDSITSAGISPAIVTFSNGYGVPAPIGKPPHAIIHGRLDVERSDYSLFPLQSRPTSKPDLPCPELHCISAATLSARDRRIDSLRYILDHPRWFSLGEYQNAENALMEELYGPAPFFFNLCAPGNVIITLRGFGAAGPLPPPPPEQSQAVIGAAR
jgi:RHS repeat-associated protein